mmetsp:Transcript_12318/g.29610  ORF Transcript_12318/g.29610 Transcript_12318/m.29610 type:complete len:481 (-) Transcript_12318:24-1466(-)
MLTLPIALKLVISGVVISLLLQVQNNNVDAFASSASSSGKWKTIEQDLRIDERRQQRQQQTRIVDSVFDPSPPNFSTTRPTLFRERHGWCPYSERVWLALELLGVEYDTVKIDNTGHGPRPSYFGGQTPQIKWPSGKQQGESMDLVRELDTKYGDGQLFAPSNVQHCIDAFRSIFPSGKARPSSRAAFLFQYNGEPLSKSTFEETLLKTNELLGVTKQKGPFFCGSTISAADIAWAPFLERYRYQLPCLHGQDQLDPYEPNKYPNLVEWYDAMDTTSADDVAVAAAAYPCVIKGDASSWRKVLTMAGYGNAGNNVPPNIQTHMDDIVSRGTELEQARSIVDFDVWKTYKESRRNNGQVVVVVANTPHEEAASVVVQNRQRLVEDIMKQQSRLKTKSTNSNYVSYLEALPSSYDQLDDLLLELALLLKDTGQNGLKEPDTKAASESVTCLASFLDERMCVPRDMGCMPASTIKLIAAAASK